MLIYKGITDKFVEDYLEGFCKEHGIIYFPKDPLRLKWLRKWWKENKGKLPIIETKKDIKCWFCSYGVWGQYHDDFNAISICPWQIDRVGGLEDTIKHELTHLEHPEADTMSHEEKEKYIESIDDKKS